MQRLHPIDYSKYPVLGDRIDRQYLWKIMCRYGERTYKEPFVCFNCRKSYKQTNFYELHPHLRPAKDRDRIVKCPQCSQQMANIGRDFKPPKQSNQKQWSKVKILYENGYTFHSCGCCGPGFRPDELSEVQDFIESHRSKSEGERLLARILEKLERKGITSSLRWILYAALQATG